MCVCVCVCVCVCLATDSSSSPPHVLHTPSLSSPHPQFQSHIFTCLAAVLHMGNVKFSQDDNEYSQIVSTAPLQTASVRNTLTSLTSSHIHTHMSHILTHTHTHKSHILTHTHHTHPTHHCTAPNYQHTTTPTNMYTYSAYSHSHTLTHSHSYSHTQELFGIDARMLADTMTVSVSVTRGETIRKHLNKQKAEGGVCVCVCVCVKGCTCNN